MKNKTEIAKELLNSIKGNKRLTEEKYEEYRKRISIENRIIEYYLKGRLIWNSTKSGTYIKKENE